MAPRSLADLLGRHPVLVVSPHFDDAALSCAALLERTPPPDVMTAFTAGPAVPMSTEWDRDCGFADSAISIAARHAEDDAAFAGSGHRLWRVGLVDGQYLEGNRPSDQAPTLEAAVLAWTGEHPDAIVAIPAGTGLLTAASDPSGTLPGGLRGATALLRPALLLARRVRGAVDRRLQALRSDDWQVTAHPDHLFVRDTVLQLWQGRDDFSILLYEEVPYRWGRRADGEVVRLGRGLGRRFRRHDERIDRARKATRVAAYSSQLANLPAPQGPLDTARGLPGNERYYLLRP